MGAPVHHEHGNRDPVRGVPEPMPDLSNRRPVTTRIAALPLVRITGYWASIAARQGAPSAGIKSGRQA